MIHIGDHLMTNYERTILVPLDGSRLAEQVLSELQPFVTPAKTHLVLLRVVEPWAYAIASTRYAPPKPPTRIRLLAEPKAYLARQQKQWQNLGYRVTAHVVEGDAAQGILTTAQGMEVDWIAMTTHGRSGLARWALGSVAEHVLQGAEVPIFLARKEITSARERLHHILVPLDGSPLAEQALTEVQALAQQSHAKVTLLHVIQSLDAGNLKILFANEAEAEATFAEWCADAEKYLQQIAGQLLSAGIATEWRAILGDPAPTIIQVATDEQVDLIAMTTHGRTGLQRSFYGSVANKVLRGASCPLHLVRNQIVKS